MNKIFFTIIFLCSTALFVNAQGQGKGQGSGVGTGKGNNSESTVFPLKQSSAPIKWEKYKISDKDISILFPKMPILIESSDVCNQTDSRIYAVYAEEVVYQLTVYSRSKERIPDFCQIKNEFGLKTLETKTATFNSDKVEVSRLKLKEKEAIKFSGNFTTYWILDDLANNKFLVLAVTHRSDIKPNTEKFVQSVEFNKKTNSIEVNKGSLRTFGDEISEQAETQENPQKEATDVKKEGLVIVAKPRANYTDAARQNDTQGNVMLRVTFLANGGIGSISVISGLPYGITEQAIAAASKIVFLPQKRNGKTISVTKQVQYSFTIY